ncbi:gastrokine-1 [Camelus dromedarius]|uniref:gastrokine-1 n=1 Tax=Camelus dromedarius TaxID=9838 RepID=UPI00057B80E3
MKFTIVFAGLLGAFLTPAFADYNINVSDEDNSGGSGQQSVSINNEHNVANVDNNNGWGSWNSLWDYETGFAVTRLFHKKVCIVHKMNKEVMPSLQALDALVKEKKVKIGKGPGGPPPKGLMYSVSHNKVNDLDKFGKSIVTMCRGVPTYMAEEIQGASLILYSEKCFITNILWILNISFCEETVEY